jgi:hypothetical protein
LDDGVVGRILVDRCCDSDVYKREKIIRKDIITEKHNFLLLCSFVLDIYK